MQHRLATFSLSLVVLLGAFACSSGGDEQDGTVSDAEVPTTSSETVAESLESDAPSTSIAAVPPQESSVGTGARSAYFQLFGGEAVVEVDGAESLGELDIPELPGFTHTLTEIDVHRVLYLKEVEEDRVVDVPQIGTGPLIVFEVFIDSETGKQASRFSDVRGGRFIAVLDYGWGNTQADATGGWGTQAVATIEDGDIQFHGASGRSANAFFATATELFVPDRYESQEDLLVALVSEAAESFFEGEPGEIGQAVIDEEI